MEVSIIAVLLTGQLWLMGGMGGGFLLQMIALHFSVLYCLSYCCYKFVFKRTVLVILSD